MDLDRTLRKKGARACVLRIAYLPGRTGGMIGGEGVGGGKRLRVWSLALAQPIKTRAYTGFHWLVRIMQAECASYCRLKML